MRAAAACDMSAGCPPPPPPHKQQHKVFRKMKDFSMAPLPTFDRKMYFFFLTFYVRIVKPNRPQYLPPNTPIIMKCCTRKQFYASAHTALTLIKKNIISTPLKGAVPGVFGKQNLNTFPHHIFCVATQNIRAKIFTIKLLSPDAASGNCLRPNLTPDISSDR